MGATFDEKTTSYYLDHAAVRRAVALVAPMLDAALADREVVGSGFLYLVVLDPTRTPENAAYEEAVVHEQAFGDRSRWDADYAAFAHAKARLSWRTSCDGRFLQHMTPHLLRAGDSALAGGVCVDGIVVAVSGAFAAFDEVFATALAASLRGVARHARESAEPTATLQSR